MKKNITDQPLEVKSEIHGSSVEVELTKVELDTLDEAEANAALTNRIRGEFMKQCGVANKDFVDTEGMSKPKAIVACAMEWQKNIVNKPTSDAMTLLAAVLPRALSSGEMKALEAYNNKEEPLPKALKKMLATTTETNNWQEVESPNREEYAYAKTKKQWEKIDKKELDRDTKKEKEEHEKDAVKDDDSKIKKLKKGKPSEKKDVEIHDLKKDQELDKEDKIKYTKADDWEKTDEKELKEDSKKEKKEHEKDAVKDDKKQIKDLKKDIKEDKKDEKAKASDYSEYWDFIKNRN